MGTTKKYSYDESQLHFSDLCKALAHPARVSIVEILSSNQHSNCKDLQKKIQLSQSTISRHCNVLHQYGVIGYEVIGNSCFYRLNNNVLDQLSGYLDTMNCEISSITGKVYYPQQHV